MIYLIDYSFAAETDADNAGEYYDSKVLGLSLRFFDDLNETLHSVKNHPFTFHIYDENLGIRRPILLFSLMPFTTVLIKKSLQLRFWQ